MKILDFILHLLIFIIIYKICGITSSIYYAKKCNYNCKNCGMWSCTYDTEYPNYTIPPYDDFSNVCGKFKSRGDKK